MSYYISLFGTWITCQNVNVCPNCNVTLNREKCIKPKPHIRFKVCGFCLDCNKHYWTTR